MNVLSVVHGTLVQWSGTWSLVNPSLWWMALACWRPAAQVWRRPLCHRRAQHCWQTRACSPLPWSGHCEHTDIVCTELWLNSSSAVLQVGIHCAYCSGLGLSPNRGVEPIHLARGGSQDQWSDPRTGNRTPPLSFQDFSSPNITNNKKHESSEDVLDILEILKQIIFCFCLSIYSS